MGIKIDALIINEQGLKFYGKTKEDYLRWCEDTLHPPTMDDSKQKYFEFLEKEKIKMVNKLLEPPTPVSAWIDKKERQFVVEFKDGTITTTEWEDLEWFDHYDAFAICLAKKIYDSEDKLQNKLDSIFKGDR